MNKKLISKCCKCPVIDHGIELGLNRFECSGCGSVLFTSEFYAIEVPEEEYKIKRCDLMPFETGICPTPSDTFIDSKMKEFDDKFDNLFEIKSFGTEDYKYVHEDIWNFLKSSLQEQREIIEKEQLEIMTNAIEMSKISWIEQGKNEQREMIERDKLSCLISKLRKGTFTLTRIKNEWFAQLNDSYSGLGEKQFIGKTPEEAIKQLLKDNK